MSRRYPVAKWTLPEVVDPEGRRCFLIRVPDDPLHLAAFRGALLNLASAYKWQDDPAHTAKDVALVWREVIDNVEGRTCLDPLIDVRQNDTAPCTLEKTIDGATWEAWANLQLCPPKLRSGPHGGMEWFDGTSWVPLPDGGDERQDGGYDPPWPTPPSGQSGNCLAAENITAIFQTSMLQGKVALEAGMIGFGIISAIGTLLSPFIPAAIFTTAAAAIGGMIFSGGVTFLDDVTSTDNLDALKCAVSCKISTDGSVTAAQFNDIKDDLEDRITDATIRSLYDLWLDGLGPVGLSRMGAAAGITSGDCTSCGCDDIYITYAAGHGPASARIGDTITIYYDFFSGFGGYDQFNITFSRTINLQWVSGTVEARADSNDLGWWNPYPTLGAYYIEVNGASTVNAHVGETHPGNGFVSTCGTGSGPMQIKFVSEI